MIVALVNQARGAGRTTLAVHLAGELALRGKRVALLDTDRCSGALEWAECRRRNGLPALFETIGIPSPHLRCGVWGLHARFDHVVIDTPAASSAALRAALLAADTVLVPTHPERDAVGRCAATLQLVIEALAVEPALTASVVLTHAPAGLEIEPGTEMTVCGLRLPVAAAAVGERMSFAMSRGTGLLVQEIDFVGPAEVDVRRLVDEVFGRVPTGKTD
ncbi:chromosome partitioning protein [Azospirillum thermophilum]|uniref:Chromosome partitioning protein n=1 Tax=Azospirillum thermophilum TaxID=2202148 RepID=A0A2S2CNN9_9PROT|nr:chromosome partitioning protein [Azospirillum thermophilum]AWK85990.1 chromosome partitioning protein [Azospirillum thermophilum]